MSGWRRRRGPPSKGDPNLAGVHANWGSASTKEEGGTPIALPVYALAKPAVSKYLLLKQPGSAKNALNAVLIDVPHGCRGYLKAHEPILTGHPKALPMKVRIPLPPRLVVGVGNVIPGHRPLAGDFTNFCHNPILEEFCPRTHFAGLAWTHEASHDPNRNPLVYPMRRGCAKSGQLCEG